MSDTDVLVLDLQPTPASIRAARLAVANWAGRLAADDVVDTAKLLVSELATNAVRHAGEPFTVKGRWRPPVLRVDVIDGAPPPGIGERASDQVGGWGFQIVDRLADAWGVDDAGSRKAVWFEVNTAISPARVL